MIGYADLAAGDTWKAVLLIDLQLLTLRNQAFATPGSEASKKFEVLIGQIRHAYRELIESILMLEDYQGVMEICQEGTKKYRKHLQDFFRSHGASANAKIVGNSWITRRWGMQ